ncbi:beta-sandwich lipoprotein [Antrihabitans cavernicola]|uniref:Uncharacterized protein n=1 Tax=Antrihabitans cavernicola TaxID=2495913 RepID=A0A5A7S831_9NOCA|nr:hypothetical protein FOY51_15590 [Spelaeibacter cavernicola]
MRFAAVVAGVAAMVTLTSCTDTDADVASANLSKAADQFEIDRRIVFFNGITDTYLLTIEGRCAIHDDGGQLEVTCKTGEGEYKKHFLGLSDNVTYVAEQLESASVSTDHYRVIFKPEVIIPDIDRP